VTDHPALSSRNTVVPGTRLTAFRLPESFGGVFGPALHLRRPFACGGLSRGLQPGVLLMKTGAM